MRLTLVLAALTLLAHRAADAQSVSFRNDVMPVLSKAGCNAGTCHGNANGKGGFKLSLRGYAPEDDHFVLTRQALSRRVNTVEPSKSLMLLKPTMAQIGRASCRERV